jgi:hypothetical protein
VSPAQSRVVDNRKYVWDGAEYPQEPEARQAAETYRAAGFDVQVFHEGGGWLVFTRRVAASEPRS